VAARLVDQTIESKTHREVLKRCISNGMASLLSCVIAVSLAGCTSSYFVRIEPATAFQLADNEALLVIQIDTDLPIDRLELSGLTIRESIEAGRHFWVVKVRPGPQTWRMIHIAGNTRHAGSYRIRSSKYARASELDFDLQAGVINYAGELIIRRAGSRGLQTWISVRIRNHAAMALRDLEQKYGDLLDHYSIRMAGSSGDAFVEFYASERARIGRQKAESEAERLRE
jgi:hypothetical protein